MKYTKEEKIEWVMQYLSGMPLRYPPGVKKANFKKMIRYLAKRYQDHGETYSVVAVASRIDQVHEEGNRES